MLEPKKIKINGTDYTIGLHPGRAGLKTALKVQSVLQSEIAGIQSVIAGKFTNSEREAMQRDENEAQRIIQQNYQADLMSGVERMLRNLDPDQLYDLLIDLFQFTLAGDTLLNSDSAIDAHFQGRYADVYPLAREVIEANGFLELSVQDLL